MLWIGHPWTFVRTSRDVVRFVEPSEQQDPIGLNELPSVSRAALLDAIQRASDERNRFAARLLPVIKELNPRVAAADLVRVLVRGHA